MKFIISKGELASLLSKLQNVVSQKSAVPILSNILIEAAHNELVITATDMMVGMRCYTRNCKILEEGGTTLPARHFTHLIRELTTPEVEICTDAKDITEVISGSSHFKVHGMSRTEFPSLPDLSGGIQFTVKQKELKDVFFQTAFAISREDNRYVLTGLFMHIAHGKATFVGTDGKRLAKTHLPVSLDESIKGEYIIPLKAVEEMLKNLNEEKEAIVYLLSDKIAVEANQSILVTKLLSGDYPDINRVIPTTQPQVITLHREELITLLRQVSLFTSETNQSVRFTFHDGELKLAANTMEVGEGRVSMPVNYYSEKLDIAFNPGFFLDILRRSEEVTVYLGVIDAFNPGVITREPLTASSEEANPLFVIMPMRLTEEA